MNSKTGYIYILLKDGETCDGKTYTYAAIFAGSGKVVRAKRVELDISYWRVVSVDVTYWPWTHILHTHQHSISKCVFLPHTQTHPFNSPFSGTTRLSRYQKGKTNLDFTEVRDSEWQWHQLGHMQLCTLLQTDNHASTPPLSFYRPDALPAA